MTYKKTFWFNVALTTLASLLAVTAIYFHVIEEHLYNHLFRNFVAYSCLIATPLLTAISLKRDNCKWLNISASLLNFAGTCIFFYPVYNWITTPLLRDLYTEQVIAYLFIYLIPSLINLKALRKL